MIRFEEFSKKPRVYDVQEIYTEIQKGPFGSFHIRAETDADFNPVAFNDSNISEAWKAHPRIQKYREMDGLMSRLNLDGKVRYNIDSYLQDMMLSDFYSTDCETIIVRSPNDKTDRLGLLYRDIFSEIKSELSIRRLNGVYQVNFRYIDKDDTKYSIFFTTPDAIDYFLNHLPEMLDSCESADETLALFYEVGLFNRSFRQNDPSARLDGVRLTTIMRYNIEDYLTIENVDNILNNLDIPGYYDRYKHSLISKKWFKKYVFDNWHMGKLRTILDRPKDKYPKLFVGDMGVLSPHIIFSRYPIVGSLAEIVEIRKKVLCRIIDEHNNLATKEV